MNTNTWRDRRTSRRSVSASIPVLAAALPALAFTASGSPKSAMAASRQATPAASQADGNLEARLRPIIEQKMSELLVPGAVVLVRTPAEEYVQAFGTRTIGQDDPVTIDDNFRIGSNTKTMSGTVLLQLVQEGLISLDDPVSKYREDIPNGENITISMLLDMTSGLHNYSELESFNKIMDDDPGRAWQPEELLAIGIAEPPYFAPGEGFHYSNTNTVLFALIAEQLTGKPLEALFTERIFMPLGLKHTVFPTIDDASLPDPHPHGYLYGTNVSTVETTALPKDEQDAARNGSLLPNDVTDLNPSWGWAAGAASSTVSDLAIYVRTLVGGGLLDAAMQQQRLASLHPTSDAPGAASYGLALAQFGPFIGHDGSLPGYQSFMAHDPATDATLIVLTNLQSSPDGLMTANEIARPIISELYGASSLNGSPSATPAS